MTIRMIEGRHLTATNKRHISELVALGIFCGGTKALHYTIEMIDQARANVQIIKRERDDWGRPVRRKSRYVVEFA